MCEEERPLSFSICLLHLLSSAQGPKVMENYRGPMWQNTVKQPKTGSCSCEVTAIPPTPCCYSVLTTSPNPARDHFHQAPLVPPPWDPTISSIQGGPKCLAPPLPLFLGPAGSKIIFFSFCAGQASCNYTFTTSSPLTASTTRAQSTGKLAKLAANVKICRKRCQFTRHKQLNGKTMRNTSTKCELSWRAVGKNCECTLRSNQKNV